MKSRKMPDGKSIIRFEGASKTFGEITAVDGVSLDIFAGEIFGIIGRSGAGKSTLVRLINALEKLSAGQIAVDGVNISSKTKGAVLKELRTNIGMIFQSFNLFNARTVFKNVEYPLRLAGMNRVERKKRVEELLDFVGLSQKAGVYPSKLSGGQKQRVSIARALATNPKILLADEATSALDPETTLDILRLLKKVNAEFGCTIVLITHTMSVVKLICDRVAVMSAGKVVEIGETKQLFVNPQHDITRSFIEILRTLESGKL